MDFRSSLPPSLIESIVESWFIEAARLSILLSILISKYAATAMGNPTFAIAFKKSSMIFPPFLHDSNKYAGGEEVWRICE